MENKLEYTQITSVKVNSELYRKFKYKSVERQLTFNKFVEAALFIFSNNENFENLILSSSFSPNFILEHLIFSGSMK